MKFHAAPLGLLALLALSAPAALAQGVPPPVIGRTAAPENPNAYPVSVADRTKPEVLKRLRAISISFQVKNAPAEAALLQLLDYTSTSLVKGKDGKPLFNGYEFDPAFYPPTNGPSAALDLPAREVTVRLTEVPLPRALDSVCGSLGIGWYAEENDGAIIIRIVRLRGTVTLTDLWRRNGLIIPNPPPQPNPRETYFGDFTASLDKKDITAEDAVREIFREKPLPYVMDDDRLDGKYALTFKDLPLPDALNTICQRAGIGWELDMSGKEPIVRIGKRYVQKGVPAKPAP